MTERWVRHACQARQHLGGQLSARARGHVRARRGGALARVGSHLKTQARGAHAELVHALQDLAAEERKLLRPGRRRHVQRQHVAAQASGFGARGDTRSDGAAPRLTIDRDAARARRHVTCFLEEHAERRRRTGAIQVRADTTVRILEEPITIGVGERAPRECSGEASASLRSGRIGRRASNVNAETTTFSSREKA